MDIVIFADAWGTRFGGVNAFNTNLCIGLAQAGATVWCAIPDQANCKCGSSQHPRIEFIPLSLPLTPLSSIEAHEFLSRKVGRFIDYWVGHDVITGDIAVEAKRRFGGYAVVFHHMAYYLYSSRKTDGLTTFQQDKKQRKILPTADILVAVGPLLHQHAGKFVADDQRRFMIVPGLIEEPQPTLPSRSPFSVFLSGRLDPENDPIKNGRLGVMAFALTGKRLMEQDYTRPFPVLNLFGLSEDTKQAQLEAAQIDAAVQSAANYKLHLNLAPFSEDGKHYLAVLAESHVALVLSWHDGFALTAWEAVSLAVPLVLSSQTGAYQYLMSLNLGDLVNVITPTGVPDNDALRIAEILSSIEANYEQAKERAFQLRSALLARNHTWTAAASRLMDSLDKFRLATASRPRIPGLSSLYRHSEEPLDVTQPSRAEPEAFLIDELIDGFQGAEPKQQQLVVARFLQEVRRDHLVSGDPQYSYNTLMGGLVHFQQHLGKTDLSLAPLHEFAGYLLVNCHISPSSLRKADHHLSTAATLFENSPITETAVSGLVTSSWLRAVSKRLQGQHAEGIEVVKDALKHPLIDELASDIARIKLFRERAIIEGDQGDLAFLCKRIEELGASDIEAFHTTRRLFELLISRGHAEGLESLQRNTTRLFGKIGQRVDPIYQCMYHRDLFQYNMLRGKRNAAEKHYRIAIQMAKNLRLRGQERTLQQLHIKWNS